MSFRCERMVHTFLVYALVAQHEQLDQGQHRLPVVSRFREAEHDDSQALERSDSAGRGQRSRSHQSAVVRDESELRFGGW